MMMKEFNMKEIVLNVNGRNHRLNVDDKWNLLYVLRDVLDLTGTKFGCGTGTAVPARF